MSEETVTFNLDLKINPNTVAGVNELNTALRQYLSLARRTGLPSDIVQGLSTLQQAMILSRLSTRGIEQLARGTMMGAVLGTGGLALSGFMAFDIVSQLIQYGAQETQRIMTQIAAEQQLQLETMQMELRRKRW